MYLKRYITALVTRSVVRFFFFFTCEKFSCYQMMRHARQPQIHLVLYTAKTTTMLTKTQIVLLRQLVVLWWTCLRWFKKYIFTVHLVVQVLWRYIVSNTVTWKWTNPCYKEKHVDFVWKTNIQTNLKISELRACMTFLLRSYEHLHREQWNWRHIFTQFMCIEMNLFHSVLVLDWKSCQAGWS